MNTRPQWRPIETAPKDGTFVLIAVPEGELESGPVTIGQYLRFEERDEDGKFKPGHFYPATGWCGMDGDGHPSDCEPTHWMPLPEGPQ
jgi:hypothetical protein